MRIHKEGYKLTGIAILDFIVTNFIFQFLFRIFILSDVILLLSILLTLFIIFFFRSPKRIININENIVLSPADGKIVAIEEVYETEYFNEKRLQVSVFMSPLNIHLNRYPVGGVVKNVKYNPGKYLVAWHPKSSLENERMTTVIQKQDGNKILICQIAGFLARRVVCYAKENNTVKQGEELGFIKFGSRVDMLLPLNAKIKVSLNEKVKGGITEIACIN
ncbi:MAG: phosphatidylserine decarboxylase family protein [Bacteroidales bacterium]|nr:phosphatidylserine decarboxylase family protein [Bacteroidales bacterium]